MLLETTLSTELIELVGFFQIVFMTTIIMFCALVSLGSMEKGKEAWKREKKHGTSHFNTSMAAVGPTSEIF